jgi:hypothetical protein
VEPDQFADTRVILGARNPRIADYDLSRLLDNSFVDAAVARGLAGPE